MTRPPNEDPEGRRKQAEGPGKDRPFVISEQRIRTALSDAIGRLSKEQLEAGREALTDEEKSLDRTKAEKLQEEVNTLKINNADLRQNTELRQTFAAYAYKIVKWWMIIVVVIVAFQGLTWPSSVMIKDKPWNVPIFELSDAAMIALLTTTTINVIGLLLAVTLNLFPPKKG